MAAGIRFFPKRAFLHLSDNRDLVSVVLVD